MCTYNRYVCELCNKNYYYMFCVHNMMSSSRSQCTVVYEHKSYFSLYLNTLHKDLCEVSVRCMQVFYYGSTNIAQHNVHPYHINATVRPCGIILKNILSSCPRLSYSASDVKQMNRCISYI